MSQSHLAHSNHASSQPLEGEQTGIIVNDRLQNDLVNTGIIIHDSGAQLEDESNCKTSLNRFAILTWLGNVCDWLIGSLSGSSELQVRQQRDRNGNILWLIYDPLAQHSVQLCSEEDARTWIEQSYSRR